MTTMTTHKPTIRQAWRDSKARYYDKLDQKALDKARRRGHSTATILATGRDEYEALLNRGWTLVQAHGDQTIFDMVRRYEMTKRILGK